MMQEFPLEMIKFCEMCKKKKKQGVLRVEEWYISTGPFTIIELLPKRVIFSFPRKLTVDVCIIKDRGKTSASPVF